jgi:hypothetical protein
MGNFAGRPTDINRFLGMCDADDPSNLPVGLAALARNIEFQLTSAEVRAGVNTTIKGLNQSPITGLMGCTYTPEKAEETFFQLPLIFDMKGALQRETPVGGGITKQIKGTAPLDIVSILVFHEGPFNSFVLVTLGGPCPYHVGDKVTLNGLTNAYFLNGVELDISFIPATGNQFTAPFVHPVYGPTADTGFVTVELITLPQNSHMIGTQAYNKAWLAFSDLITPTAGMAVLDLKTLNLDPYGMKPYGWTWVKNTHIYAGEVATPTQKGGTGHTYQCITPGITGPIEPVWPLDVGAIVNDGTVVWQEKTAVVANVLPAPIAPDITVALGGSYASGEDAYVLLTLVNGEGETLPGPAAFVTTDSTHLSVQLSLVTLFQNLQQWIKDLPAPYTITAVKVYTATVTHGNPAPATSSYQFKATVLITDPPSLTITTPGGGAAPPIANTARITPVGNIKKNSDATHFRDAGILFIDRNLSWSGFTIASVIPVNIPDDGYEIGVFNVPSGPAYIAARAIAFTVADGTAAGPFFVIGNYLPGQADNFVYPQTDISNGIAMTSTVFGDNETSSGLFNFTDQYLAVPANDVTDRLRVIWPYPCVDIYYSKTTNRLIQTGIPGFYSGHYVSLAGDPESYYGDTSGISIGADDGERAICAREFRGTLYSLRERSGFVITPNTGDPSTWNATQRWEKVGPCGPRAVDVCGRFMLFVHRSGIYKYEESDPEHVIKELPRWWQQVNWAAANVVWCAIDEETQTVRIGLPIGASTVPNQVLVLDYKEGWNNPIHFSVYSAKEISMDAARKYAVHDISAFVAGRIERKITGQPPFLDGPEGIPQLDPSFFTSQFLFGSSGPDGTVQARTPGIWNDNGQGIDAQYECVSVGAMMSVAKLEGINLNARGNGKLFASFLSGRDMVSDWSPTGKSKEVKLREIDPCSESGHRHHPHGSIENLGTLATSIHQRQGS